MSEQPKDTETADHEHHEMMSEASRLESFKSWPFKRGPCTKEKMAEAGFFQVASSGESTEPNVECFVCAITLDGWLQHEEPFKEHLAHSPLCPFAQAGKPQGGLTVREWIEVLRARNDKINENQLKSMHEQLEEKIAKLAALCESVKKD